MPTERSQRLVDLFFTAFFFPVPFFVAILPTGFFAATCSFAGIFFAVLLGAVFLAGVLVETRLALVVFLRVFVEARFTGDFFAGAFLAGDFFGALFFVLFFAGGCLVGAFLGGGFCGVPGAVPFGSQKSSSCSLSPWNHGDCHDFGSFMELITFLPSDRMSVANARNS
jgi:hypothetical protein